MKICPTCGARAFDDAETCFGCLRPFNNDDAPSLGKHAVRHLDLPTLVISVDAVRLDSGDLEWRYSVDRARSAEGLSYR